MRHFFIKTWLLLFVTSPAWAIEIIHYDNLPVTVELREGEERSIQFGSHVQVGVTKGQQLQKMFRVQSAQGAVHFLPYEEFDKQRIQIRRMSDGQVILLDLIASPAVENAEPLETLRLVLASDNVVSDKNAQASTPRKAQRITPIDLTRYAAQNLYGPSRLHSSVPGISDVNLTDKGAVKVFKGAARYQTLSKPVVAYRGGGHYLAALHIRNVSTDPVQLNYLDINLPFSHATLQHHQLEPMGTPGDSTMLYLISERPLKETLYPWTYYQDLKRETQASLNDR
jgi:integrating conjugative element protein (TIGR03749 family)